MENQKFNPNDLEGSVPNIDELNFDLAGMESYYERRVLKVGRGIMDVVNADIEG